MFETLMVIIAFLLGFWCRGKYGSLPELYKNIKEAFTGEEAPKK